MDENAKNIFEASNKIITRLQLLSTFFEDETVFKIYIRSQVIHRLFETNDDELDIHKLNLFHLQYTESIVELLKKIKKANEKNVTLIFDEIQFNEILVGQMKAALTVEETYEIDRARQSQIVNESIRTLYKNLSDLSRENPFPQTIYQFGRKYAKEHFHTIPQELFDELIVYSLDEEYKNGYGIIDKKVLGLQCKNGFDNVYVCGLICGNETLEVYKLRNQPDHFLFYPGKNFYNDFDLASIDFIDLVEKPSTKAKMALDLKEKNIQLEQQAVKVKTQIPDEIKVLLNEYYTRISDIDFLDFTDHEVQANILKAMLNTNDI